MNITISDASVARIRALTERTWREPFTRRAWAELGYFLVSGALAAAGFALVAVLMVTGTLLAVTFVGLALLALSIRVARGLGRWQRGLARSLLGEHIEDPDPFTARPGFLGWLQSALRDRVGWRAAGCLVLQLVCAFLGTLVALSLWWDAFACLLHPLLGRGGGGPAVWGLVRSLFPSTGSLSTPLGFVDQLGIFVLGLFLLLAAPWVMRGFVHVDRVLVRNLLGPDPLATRVRSLEQARTDTVDASAATLRRIERDLHDGTQAQLVAIAMRLGMAKEKLDDPDHPDVEAIRRLVDDAHRGAKEAIVELRDIARGIHPPVLDTGLEGALTSLAARNPVPTDVSVDLTTRPTPAVESIAYFCAAELLANVAQHARATRATLSCRQHGGWLRLVVRDDGRGGAEMADRGSRSSGLTGLADRVRAVDGHLHLVSPLGGPTVVTVDLPMTPGPRARCASPSPRIRPSSGTGWSSCWSTAASPSPAPSAIPTRCVVRWSNTCPTWPWSTFACRPRSPTRGFGWRSSYASATKAWASCSSRNTSRRATQPTSWPATPPASVICSKTGWPTWASS